MTSSKEPVRKCIACAKRNTKDKFLMLVRPPKSCYEAKIEIFNGTHKKSGRGYYICKDSECIKRAKKMHRLERLFSKRQSENIENLYVDLEKAVAECE